MILSAAAAASPAMIRLRSSASIAPSETVSGTGQGEPDCLAQPPRCSVQGVGVPGVVGAYGVDEVDFQPVSERSEDPRHRRYGGRVA